MSLPLRILLLSIQLALVACNGSQNISRLAGGSTPDPESPSKSTTKNLCGSSTCKGCCTADGVCLAGTANNMCGGRGEACADCAAVDTVCRQSACWNEKRLNGYVDDSKIHLAQTADIYRLREDLIDFVWGDRGFPTNSLPAKITQNDASPLAGGATAARVDSLEIAMDGGFTSKAYLLWPSSPKGKLVVFHQGHSDYLSAFGGDATVSFFLERGWTVLALTMPMYGENTGPVTNHDHDAMIALRSTALGYDPLRWFLEPVVVSLNYAHSVEQFSDVAMIGISGGGWTTTWIAAIDPRVQFSFPVAGSLPLSQRIAEFGDAEQYDPAIYSRAGYPDLYVLGAVGQERRQLQIFNRYDACCFGATRYQVYEKAVAQSAANLDRGDFSVFLDESHQSHTISNHALAAGVNHALEGDGVIVADDIYPPWGAFSTTGDWRTFTGQGFGGDVQFAAPGDTSAVATWKFTVEPGTYRVSATWFPYSNRATNAPFAVIADVTETVRINERLAPYSREDAGVSWQDLTKSIVVSGDTLLVTVSGDADGYVVADGIRVERLP